MIMLHTVARELIRSGKGRATCLVHHTTNGNGAQSTYIAYENIEQQRTDHYKVADCHLSFDQLPERDRKLFNPSG